MAVVAAKHLGAENLFAIEFSNESIEMAKQFVATALKPSSIDAKTEIMNATNGRGADAVMEVVGSPVSLRYAMYILRQCVCIS